MTSSKRILLIIGGGIAAYKSLDLIRRLQDAGYGVRAIITKGGQEFITPLSVAALTGEHVYTDLFSLTDEAEMGHIRLSREADLVLVAPATANMIAQMAAGLAADLATTTLLATDKPVMVCPAMNVEMWAKPATERNVSQLKSDGVTIVGPDAGALACGEEGAGRMSDVANIVTAVDRFFGPTDTPLKGKRVLVTAGPTHEAIDPVRYIANQSSGKQGYAIASALAELGADVELVSGPTNLPCPKGVKRSDVISALDMLKACETALPADAAIFVAAVADWRIDKAGQLKLKKGGDGVPQLNLVENPDILATLSKAKNRPQLVVGFAAETNDVIDNARAKLARKGCDYIVANDVSAEGGVMGGDHNQVTLLGEDSLDVWPKMNKADVAAKLARFIADKLIKG